MYPRLFAVIFLALFLAQTLLGQHQSYFPDPDTSIQRRLEEWRDLKFGLLMHWGPYSQWGIVESWSICPEDLSWATGARKAGMSDEDYYAYRNAYEQLPKTFDPVRFEPEKWAAAARKAGMKYMVFTTKHHDGFCMFDTKLTDYKITGPDCPFAQKPRSNAAKEIFGAFRNEGLWTGAYFSKPDWHCDHYWWKRFPPSDRNCNYSIEKYPEKWAQFKQFTHGQIEELMTGYGKMDILWLDGGWVRPKTEEELASERIDHYEGSRWARNPQSQDIDMPALVQKARSLQPGLIVVDRAVPGIHQNYLTPEQHIPDEGLPYPWETCMTMATSWSHVPNDRYKSADELIEKLVDIVSKGGNFLLNIGPSPTGEWDANAYDRLAEMGAWLDQNGKSIYGTRMWKTFGEGERIRFTQSKDGQTVYVFLLDAPQKSLTIKQLDKMPKAGKVKLLGNGASLPWKLTAEGLQVQFPPDADRASKHVWVLEVKYTVIR